MAAVGVAVVAVAAVVLVDVAATMAAAVALREEEGLAGEDEGRREVVSAVEAAEEVEDAIRRVVIHSLISHLFYFFGLDE
jgi:hypothetical protein|mmetsp:Transcript_452/g.1773  ORF Transcript_452/g.1773 Transcript_452/m.1773 type:complete len:80 (-) Transcript_452:1706-1945(-)